MSTLTFHADSLRTQEVFVMDGLRNLGKLLKEDDGRFSPIYEIKGDTIECGDAHVMMESAADQLAEYRQSTAILHPDNKLKPEIVRAQISVTKSGKPVYLEGRKNASWMPENAQSVRPASKTRSDGKEIPITYGVPAPKGQTNRKIAGRREASKIGGISID